MPSPIPLPTAENLLVPKSRRAIAITKSQCQIENSPITPPRAIRAFRARRRSAELPVKSLGYAHFRVKRAWQDSWLRTPIPDAYQAELLKSILERMGFRRFA